MSSSGAATRAERIYPRRSPRVAWRTIDGLAVLMDPDRAVLSTLNAVGTLIWCAADGEKSVAAIAEHVAAEFEVSAEVARGDAERFIAALCRRGLMSMGERSGQ